MSDKLTYLGKDFASFKSMLLNYVKTYFSNTITTFDESDPAMMFIELSAYIGDVLSYYIDSNLKESLLEYAQEKKNVVALSQALGYKSTPTKPAIAMLDLYQLVPSKGTGINNQPDYSYALTIKEGLQVIGNGITFRCNDKIIFSITNAYSPTVVTIHQMNGNEPSFYLLKKQVEVFSGEQKTVNIQIKEAEKYKKILLNDTNIISVDSIIDTEGNQWSEVQYLAQDTILESIQNIPSNSLSQSTNSDSVPYLLKNKRVINRFVTRYTSDDKLEIQFGAGISNLPSEEFLPNPDNIGLFNPNSGGFDNLNKSWDLANFMYSDSYGKAPSNTTLTIKYTVGGGIKSNVPERSITTIRQIEFENTSGLVDSVLNFVKTTFACNNQTAASGGRNYEDIAEIKLKAISNFSAQDRTVTRDDYIIRSLSMPSKYGSISKAYITQDDQIDLFDNKNKIKNTSALNLYVLGYNDKKQLTEINNSIKENLKTYINRYRMLTDSINIKNAYIINIGVKFIITTLSDYSSNEVIGRCISKLSELYNIDKMQINQPIVLTDIYRVLANTKGVQSVIDVEIVNLFDADSGYSTNVYDIISSTVNGVLYPSMDPSIFEIKYPNKDIVGKSITY